MLFIIYINDLKNCTGFFNFIIYADDTTLFHPLSNCIGNDDFQTINCEMEKVYHWLCANRLSLNISKTKFMIFHNKGKNMSSIDPEIKLKGHFNEQVDNFNFLGIIINENLSWTNHITNISIKISKSLGIMYKMKHFLPLNILKTLYSSMILPHLTYGILAWGKEASSFFLLQKKAVRIITSSKYNSHTDPLFKDLALLKVEDIYKINILKFYFKYCNNQLPYFFQQFSFQQQSDVHQYDTGQKCDLKLSSVKKQVSQNSLRHVIPKMINQTPRCITDKIKTHCLQGFVSYIKIYFINSYKSECTLHNCYICNSS